MSIADYCHKKLSPYVLSLDMMDPTALLRLCMAMDQDKL